MKKNVALWLLEDTKGTVTQQLFHDDPMAFFNSLDPINDKNATALIGLNPENLSHWHLIQYKDALINLKLMREDRLGWATKYGKAALNTN